MKISPKPAMKRQVWYNHPYRLNSPMNYLYYNYNLPCNETNETISFNQVATQMGLCNTQPEINTQYDYVFPTSASKINLFEYQSDSVGVNRLIYRVGVVIDNTSTVSWWSIWSSVFPSYAHNSLSIRIALKAVSTLYYWNKRTEFSAGTLQYESEKLYNSSLKLFVEDLKRVEKNSKTFDIMSLFLCNCLLVAYTSHHPTMVPLVSRDGSCIDFIAIIRGANAVYSLLSPEMKPKTMVMGVDEIDDKVKPVMKGLVLMYPPWPRPSIILFPFIDRLNKLLDEYSKLVGMEQSKINIYREAILQLSHFANRFYNNQIYGPFHSFLSTMPEKMIPIARQQGIFALLLIYAFCSISVLMGFQLDRKHNIYYAFMETVEPILNKNESIKLEMGKYKVACNLKDDILGRGNLELLFCL